MNKPWCFHEARIILAATALWLCCGSVAFAGPRTTNALMQESFQQFDQKLDTGWRVLQVQGDYVGAANTMLDYLSMHTATLKPWQKDSLAFHLGHVYALAGKRDEAIYWFRKSIAGHRMDNPAYVNGFIDFLQNDKPALLADRSSIAAMHPSLARAGDLREMDAMLEYFGEPFEAA